MYHQFIIIDIDPIIEKDNWKEMYIVAGNDHGGYVNFIKFLTIFRFFILAQIFSSLTNFIFLQKEQFLVLEDAQMIKIRPQ